LVRERARKLVVLCTDHTLYKEARDRASNVETALKNIEKRNSIFIESKGMEFPMEGSKIYNKAEATLEDKIKVSIKVDVKKIFSDKKPDSPSPQENEKDKTPSVIIEKPTAEPVVAEDKPKVSKDEYLNVNFMCLTKQRHSSESKART
jgi:hypothetical protein